MAYGYYPGYQAYQPTYQTYQAPQIPQQTMQNGGFISVRGIDEAFNWPVAPGNSVMFKDENSPYVYTKTRGFSQLDQPVFEKYRLVKEEEGQPQPKAIQQRDFGEDIASLWEEVRHLQSDIKQIRAERPGKKRKEGTADEPSPAVQPVPAES